jgi:DNA replication protein DnaC
VEHRPADLRFQHAQVRVGLIVGQRSTALATNIDFAAWDKYIGDSNLTTAFLDRIVDAAIILKINGKSYRAHRAQSPKPAPKAKS